MAGRPSGSDDKDWEFLDAVITLAMDIVDQAETVKSIIDDPDVLYANLKIESAALIIKKRAKDYRPRLEALKKEARRSQQQQATLEEKPTPTPQSLP